MKYFWLLLVLSGTVSADSATSVADSKIHIMALSTGDTQFPCEITTRNDLELPLSGSVLKFYQLSGCGGGNSFQQILLVVTNRNGMWTIDDEVEIGNDHYFGVDRIKVENNVLIVSGKTWGEQEPHCCPTVMAERKYKLANQKLVSVD